jgi:hypothetical protein
LTLPSHRFSVLLVRVLLIKLSMLPSGVSDPTATFCCETDYAERKSKGSVRPLVASAGIGPRLLKGIFKRLYELNLSEPLRLEALVALLENINTYCPKLGKDMGTWATYAPTNTEPQRRLQDSAPFFSAVVPFGTRPDVAARADRAESYLLSFLFIRTAFMEQISSSRLPDRSNG